MGRGLAMKKWINLLLAVVVGGCAPDPAAIHADYGAGLNELREKHGIPIVPPQWEASFTGTHYRFRNAAADDPAVFSRPIHLVEAVSVDDDGNLVNETDTYLAAASETYLNYERVRVRKAVRIRFSYAALEEGRAPWGAWVELSEDEDNKQVSLADAEAILVEWGLR